MCEVPRQFGVNMKIVLFKTLLLISIFSVISSCSNTEPIKIGYIATLTGRTSDSGVKARKGAKLAIDILNEQGGLLGRNLELIVRDNENDVAKNSNAISELIAEGVVAIIGPLRSDMARSSLDAIAGKDVLMISPTISTDSISNIDDNFLRVIPIASNQAISLAKKIIKDGYKTVSVALDSSNEAYTEPLYEAFKQEYMRHQGVVHLVGRLNKKDESEFVSLASKINDENADALLLITSGIDAAFLCQQLKKLHYNTNIYGSYWVKSGSLIEEGGRSVEGIKIVTSYEREKKSSDFLKFQEKYQDTYKDNPQYLAIYAYDSVKMLSVGIKEADSDNPETIKNKILDIGKFEGLKDDFEINKYGDATRNDMFVTISNGSFIRIEN